MSLNYHGYKVKKKELWNVVEKIRELYKKEHKTAKSIRLIIDEWLEEDDLQHKDLSEAVFNLIDFFTDEACPEEGYKSNRLVELQLYDLNKNEYSFRVLENGYFFMNEVSERIDEITNFSYDNRTPLTEEEDERENEIDKIVDMQENEKYMLIPILTKDHLFDIHMRGYKEEEIKNKIKNQKD